jgi:hypothetical protein
MGSNPIRQSPGVSLVEERRQMAVSKPAPQWVAILKHILQRIRVQIPAADSGNALVVSVFQYGRVS